MPRTALACTSRARRTETVRVSIVYGGLVTGLPARRNGYPVTGWGPRYRYRVYRYQGDDGWNGASAWFEHDKDVFEPQYLWKTRWVRVRKSGVGIDWFESVRREDFDGSCVTVWTVPSVNVFRSGPVTGCFEGEAAGTVCSCVRKLVGKSWCVVHAGCTGRVVMRPLPLLLARTLPMVGCDG